MIRITTDRAIEALLVRHREDITRQYREDLTRQLAAGIETLAPEHCGHAHRPQCPRCSARRTVQTAATLVRETGGVA